MSELRVARAALGGALARAAATLPRSTIPILSTVRLEAGPEGLSVAATDMDLLYTERIDDEPRPPWVGCVAGAALGGFVGALPAGGDVSLTDPGAGRLTISHNRATARLATFRPEDWPSFRRQVDDAVHLAVEGQTLAAALRCVADAISDDDGRHYLRGVFLEPEALVATDGHRLGRFVWPEALPPFRGAILPQPTVARLLALLKGVTEPVEMTLSHSSVVFKAPRWTLQSKLVDGTYPDYRRVLPALGPDPLVADRGELLAAIERVAGVMDRRRTRGLKLEAADGELRVTAECAGAAEAEDVVCVAGSRARVMVGLQVPYLTAALEALAPVALVELHLARTSPAGSATGTDPRPDG